MNQMKQTNNNSLDDAICAWGKYVPVHPNSHSTKTLLRREEILAGPDNFKELSEG